MNTPIIEGDQLEIDFNLDRPEFSICPSCAAQVIKLADGCGVCGWSQDEKLLGGEDKLLEQKRGERSSPSQELSIPCTIKQLNQPEVKGVIKEDKGDRFTVYIPDDNSTPIYTENVKVRSCLDLLVRCCQDTYLGLMKQLSMV